MARSTDHDEGTTWWSRKSPYGRLAIVMALLGVVVALVGILLSNTPALLAGVGFIGIFTGVVLHSLDRASRRR